jgi:hypothetical protein
MTVSDVHLDSTVEAYVAEVLNALEEHGEVTLVAAYLLGSLATGTFDPARSDVDLVVVVDRSLAGKARGRFIECVGHLDCRFRSLELVVYAGGAQPPDFDLNLNVTSAGGPVEKPNKPEHWFVIDAAMAQEHALSFGDDEAWSAHFEPIEAERLEQAFRASLAWSEHQPLENEFARLNAIRCRHYLEHGEWLSKQEASR